MDRRSFLALLASAPIAALAPLPAFLPTPKLSFHPDAFKMAMEPLIDLPTGPITSMDLLDDYLLVVSGGVGYIIDSNKGIIQVLGND